MLSGGSEHDGSDALGVHLESEKINERVALGPGRGLASNTIREQIAELKAGASHGRTSRPLYHLYISPPIGFDHRADVFRHFVGLVEKEFGLEDQPRAEVAHFHDGRWNRHSVWSRVREDGSPIRFPHDYMRRQRCAVETALHFGMPCPPLAHAKAVHKALIDQGKLEAAAFVKASGELDRARRVARQSPAERMRAERTGSNPDAVHDAVLRAWRGSDDGPSLRAALASEGLILAIGDPSPRRAAVAVVIDSTGAAYPLAKTVGKETRQEGTRVKAAEVHARVQGLDLPTVAEARAMPALAPVAPPPAKVEPAPVPQPEVAPAPEMPAADLTPIKVTPPPAEPVSPKAEPKPRAPRHSPEWTRALEKHGGDKDAARAWLTERTAQAATDLAAYVSETERARSIITTAADAIREARAAAAALDDARETAPDASRDAQRNWLAEKRIPIRDAHDRAFADLEAAQEDARSIGDRPPWWRIFARIKWSRVTAATEQRVSQADALFRTASTALTNFDQWSRSPEGSAESMRIGEEAARRLTVPAEARHDSAIKAADTQSRLAHAAIAASLTARQTAASSATDAGGKALTTFAATEASAPAAADLSAVQEWVEGHRPTTASVPRPAPTPQQKVDQPTDDDDATHDADSKRKPS